MKWERHRDGNYYLEQPGGKRFAAIWPAQRLTHNRDRVYLWSSTEAARHGWAFTLAEAKKEAEAALEKPW